MDACTLAIYLANHKNTIPAGWINPCMHQWNILTSKSKRFNPYISWFVLLIIMPAKVGIKSFRFARVLHLCMHGFTYPAGIVFVWLARLASLLLVSLLPFYYSSGYSSGSRTPVFCDIRPALPVLRLHVIICVSWLLSRAREVPLGDWIRQYCVTLTQSRVIFINQRKHLLELN